MYKTTYQSALDANKLKYEDLLPKTREQLDQVKNVENELKEIHASLADAPAEDKAAINVNIGTVEKLLMDMDQAVVIKINGTIAMKEKVVKMQNGRLNKKAAVPAASAPAAAAAAPAAPAPDDKNTSQQQQAPAAGAEPGKVVNMPTPAAAAPAQVANTKPVDDKKPAKKRNWIGLTIGAAFTVLLAGYGYVATQNKLWPFNKK